MLQDVLVEPSAVELSAPPSLRGARRVANEDAGTPCVEVGRWPMVRVARALDDWCNAEALTERRATEWTADAETWPEAIPVVGLPRLRTPW